MRTTNLVHLLPYLYRRDGRALCPDLVHTAIPANMEQIQYGYSMKNIPIAGKDAYNKCLLGKIGSLLVRMRNKVRHFEMADEGESGKHTYGFKSVNTPPAVEHLSAFEEDLYSLARSIQFTQHKNTFQQKLARDVRDIKNSSSVLVSADKTTNLYSMPSDEYRKLLRENISKSYKTTGNATKQAINREAGQIATELGIEDRVEEVAEKEAYITLKDHKEGFWN